MAICAGLRQHHDDVDARRMMLPAFAKARSRAQSITCVNNMKQLGLAFRIWATDHQDLFPFNVATNKTETAESTLSRTTDAVEIFQALANELGSPKVLVCPADRSKQPAPSLARLQRDNVSDEVETGPDVRPDNPGEVLVRCPLRGHELLCDGSVHAGPARRF
jgi:hypothetical protein